MIINKIIAADDLHWCEEEQKYISLSKEDVDQLIAACSNQDMTEFEDMYKVIQWAGIVRVGQILLKNFMSGKIKITGFDIDGEPYFGEIK
jgi:hypothetical protein